MISKDVSTYQITEHQEYGTCQNLTFCLASQLIKICAYYLFVFLFLRV
jgi:hypothetical protein